VAQEQDDLRLVGPQITEPLWISSRIDDFVVGERFDIKRHDVAAYRRCRASDSGSG
jgi:hypothetical protein